MKYRVELRERDYVGPLIESSLTDTHFPSIVQAVHAAKDVAFEWMCRVGCTVAILVLHDGQVLVRHLLPGRPTLAREPRGLETATPVPGSDDA